jgi:hypothetical protein
MSQSRGGAQKYLGTSFANTGSAGTYSVPFQKKLAALSMELGHHPARNRRAHPDPTVPRNLQVNGNRTDLLFRRPQVTRQVLAREVAFMSAHFILVPLTPQVWDEYTYWYRRRAQVCPKLPKQGIFCAAEYFDQGRSFRSLVAGVCVYNTDGEYVLFEHLSTNPTTHPRICHQAVSLIAHIARGYGAVVGKTMVALVESRGIYRIMLRAGFSAGRLTFAMSRRQKNRGARRFTRSPSTLWDL